MTRFEDDEDAPYPERPLQSPQTAAKLSEPDATAGTEANAGAPSGEAGPAESDYPSPWRVCFPPDPPEGFGPGTVNPPVEDAREGES